MILVVLFCCVWCSTLVEAATAWTNVDGVFYNDKGEVIKGALSKGIDVSYHQGIIDWGKVKQTDIEFVLIRCGYGDDDIGQDDKYFKQNIQGCSENNIQYGIYIYSHAINTEMAKSEVNHVLRLVRETNANPTYPIYYDIEANEQEKLSNDLLGNIVKVTPTSKAVGDLAIFMYKNNLNKDNILTAGASLSYPDSVVSYFRGMMGQPYGGFPKELQKIVLKDIEPLTERPGKLLPPEDLEGIKKHLIEKYHYEDKSEEVMAQKAISYALYPKVYEDYCEHFEMYNDVTRLESHVYFYGLRKGEETYLKIGEGKELLIKYLEQSDPDENGIRTLSFQVNGSIRTVKIQDHNLEIKTDRRLKADKNNPQHLGSSIPGTVDKVLVKEGDVVTKNMPLMTIEAMKMETTVVSTVNGTVDKIYVEAGDSVHQDDLLVSFHIKE